jgi:flagellar protein FliO/FliZ
VNRFLHRAGLYLLALLVLLGGSASAATPFAAPTPAAVGSTASSALRVPLALLLVLALVLGAAWLLRRLTGAQVGATQRMQVLAQLSLGTRERAVLVRVGGQDLLLGVAAGSVRTLHAFAAPVDIASASATAALAATVTGAATDGTAAAKPDFASTLREVLRRSVGK